MTLDFTALKKELRKKYRNTRKRLSDRNILSGRIVAHVRSLRQFRQAKTVALYKSFGSEADTSRLIDLAIEMGKTVVLPKVTGNDLLFYRVSPDEQYVRSSFGMEEPYGDLDKLVQCKDIDLVIVPGLAFDQNGYRLGYGRGFYDRFLSSCPAVSAGICFDCQLAGTGQIPVSEQDMPVDLLITESGVITTTHATQKGTIMDIKLITLIDHPEMKEKAAEWFSSKWSVPLKAYQDSMDECLEGKGPVPQWYLALDGERIVGGLGVIENDFHDRKDLAPNVCAVYTEPDMRGQGIAGSLLNFVAEDMKERGIPTLYLVTDHDSFYERYGWEFYCMAQGDGEPDMTRLYIHRS